MGWDTRDYTGGDKGMNGRIRKKVLKRAKHKYVEGELLTTLEQKVLCPYLETFQGRWLKLVKFGRSLQQFASKIVGEAETN